MGAEMLHFKMKPGVALNSGSAEHILEEIRKYCKDAYSEVGNNRTKTLDTLGVEVASSYDAGVGEGGSEVVSYFDGKLYVTNGEEDRIDIIDADTGSLLNAIDLKTITGYGGVNSVSVSENGIVVAVETGRSAVPVSTLGASLENDYAAPGTSITVENPIDPAYAQNGVVAIYDLNGAPKGTVEVGNLPDMVTYSRDGTMIFVANEGERQDDQDPAGSISVIDTATMTAQTFAFDAFNDQVDTLRDAGVRIFPGKTPATDFEPEYIAEAGGKLFVTLQEAASVAIFDLATMSWDRIVPLGTLDHSVSPLDASDRDDAINIQTYENLVGMRMPDAIAATEIGGQVYFLTANEGDDRGDFDEGGDAARVGDILDGKIDGLSIDASVDTTGLERLNVSIIDGDTDDDGDIDTLHAYGTRSFTIFDADGNMVFDSGSDFEKIIAVNRVPNAFNNDDFPSDDPDVIDENRSDNKGPEPEAIAVGEVDGKTLAFIGLERDSGIMIYDISDPFAAEFVDYIDSGALGHISPEVIDFISADESETGLAQIAVSYEVSGTTALFDLAFGQKIKGGNRQDTIEGTIGDDKIKGLNGRDLINGNDGDDKIKGDNGKDSLFGGAGDDTIIGGNGRDIVNGGIGNDLLVGGRGPDIFLFNLGDGQDKITDFWHRDVIDLSETGLSFDDLTITQTGRRKFTVEYGNQDDVINVIVTSRFNELNEDAFIF